MNFLTPDQLKMWDAELAKSNQLFKKRKAG